MLQLQNVGVPITKSRIAKQKVKPSTAYAPSVVKTVRLSQRSTGVSNIGRRTRRLIRTTAITQSGVAHWLDNQLTKRRRPSNVRGAFPYVEVRSNGVDSCYLTLNRLPRISGRRRLAIERAVIFPPTNPAGGLISRAVNA